MRTVASWLDDWKHIVLVLGLAVCAATVGVFVPDARWEKLGHALERFLSNPAAAVSTATTLGMVAAAFWAAWKRRPPEVQVQVAAPVVLAPPTDPPPPAADPPPPPEAA